MTIWDITVDKTRVSQNGQGQVMLGLSVGNFTVSTSEARALLQALKILSQEDK